MMIFARRRTNAVTRSATTTTILHPPARRAAGYGRIAPASLKRGIVQRAECHDVADGPRRGPTAQVASQQRIVKWQMGCGS